MYLLSRVSSANWKTSYRKRGQPPTGKELYMTVEERGRNNQVYIGCTRPPAQLNTQLGIFEPRKLGLLQVNLVLTEDQVFAISSFVISHRATYFESRLERKVNLDIKSLLRYSRTFAANTSSSAPRSHYRR